MVHAALTPLTIYNLSVGLLTALGVGYLLYTQLYVIDYRRFLTFLGAGFLVFSLGGPLSAIFAPAWPHVVHGLAALLVVFGLYDPVHNDLRREEWVDMLFRDPAQVRRREEWMRPMDERILELFHSANLVLTPAIIAYNIDHNASEVNRRLSELTDHGLVTRVERGKYRLTDLGEGYLEGRPQTTDVNAGVDDGLTNQ